MLTHLATHYHLTKLRYNWKDQTFWCPTCKKRYWLGIVTGGANNETIWMQRKDSDVKFINHLLLLFGVAAAVVLVYLLYSLIMLTVRSLQ